MTLTRSHQLLNRASLSAIVEAVHAAGISHNDISPRNILVDSHAIIHLIDFSHSTIHKCQGKGNCPELLEIENISGNIV